jgi:hypothetical protein
MAFIPSPRRLSLYMRLHAQRRPRRMSAPNVTPIKVPAIAPGAMTFVRVGDVVVGAKVVGDAVVGSGVGDDVVGDAVVGSAVGALVDIFSQIR